MQTCQRHPLRICRCCCRCCCPALAQTGPKDPGLLSCQPPVHNGSQWLTMAAAPCCCPCCCRSSHHHWDWTQWCRRPPPAWPCSCSDP